MLITKQSLEKYYEKYRNIDVIFTKNVSKILGIQTKHIYIKFIEYQRPCIVYSSSMSSAKIIVGLADDIKRQLEIENKINLRFAVKNDEKKNDDVHFFIKCITKEITSYKKEDNLYIVHLDFTAQPSEILIGLLGKLLEAKETSFSRKDERIVVDNDSLKKIGLMTAAVPMNIDNIPRQGILRDLSFNGLKVLLAGNAKFLQNKLIRLQITHSEYKEIILIGKVIRAEALAARKDIVALAVLFDSKHIPMEYTLLLTEYLKTTKHINKNL